MQLVIILLLGNPKVQTFTSRYAAAWLTQKIGSEVGIGEISLSYRGAFLLQQLKINDEHGDTMIEIGRFEFFLSGINRKSQTITFSSLSLRDTEFHLRRHQEDELSNLSYFLQYFEAKGADSTAVRTNRNPWKIKCKSLNIENAGFSYVNDLKKLESYAGIDFDNIHLGNIQIKMKDMKIEGETISGKIKQISFLERSGFDLKAFSGDLFFSPLKLSVDQMKAEVNNSSIDMDLLFEYENMLAFNDFISQVKMHGNFRPTTLDMSNIGYFAPVMFTMTDVIDLSGEISGTVDHLKGENLDVSYGRNTVFKGNIEMSGLPDIMTTYAEADIVRLSTDATDVRSFALPGDAGIIAIPELLEIAGVVNISGTYTGFYNSFVSRLNINSGLGNIGTDLTVRTTGPHNEIAYSGKINADQLDIGQFSGMQETFGKASFYLTVDGVGLTQKTINLTTNGAITSLSINGYDYNNITIDGNFKQQKFEGFLAMHDENLDFIFNGLVDLNKENPVFNFISEIRHADLFNLKLSKRDSVSVLATSLDINFTGRKLDDITGRVRIDSTFYTEGDYKYFLDSLIVTTATANDGIRSFNVVSDMLDAGFQGNYQFSSLPGAIATYLKHYSDILPRSMNYDNSNGTAQVIDFWAEFKDTGQLSKLFFPQITIAPQSKINGLFHSGDNKLDLEFCADQVVVSSAEFSDTRIATSSDDSYFYLDITAQKVLVSQPTEQTPNGIGIDSLKFITQFHADSLYYDLTWNDLSNIQRNTGDILGVFVVEDARSFKNHLSQLNLLIDNQKWSIDPENSIAITDGVFTFQDVTFYSDSSKLEIEGNVSKNESDSLRLNFKQINISNFDQLLSTTQLDVDGVLNGKATITGLFGKPNFLLDINLDKLSLNKEELGVLNMVTWWNDIEQSLWVELAINKKGNIGVGQVLSVSGNYYPMRSDMNFDLDARLNNLGIQLFNPFIRDYAKINRESLASGNLKIGGTYNQPVFNGKLSLMRTQFLINYLNAYFTLAGMLDVKGNVISLDGMTLNDTRGKSASCSGRITHNYFRDFALDLTIRHDNFKVLNTTSNDNEQFFGNAIASGVFTMQGPIDDLMMNVIARTENGTQIKIPINSAISVAENDFIIFRNTVESEEKTENAYNVNLKGLEINLDLEVNQNAEIEIFLPNSIGNIEGVGNGDLFMNINKRGDFFIYGDYEISKGTFSFTFENLIGRDFNIMQGSKLSWRGDPYAAEINIQAVHSVKTSLAGLQFQTDSSAIYNTRVEVLCIINLQNDLFNPDIRFSMDFVNVPESTKEIIFASLDTTDQSVMSQQILSLLLLNSFSYTSSGPNIGATSFKLLSNQLSNMLSKISKDFDIGIKYQPGSQLTEEELEVALRTQLFNDRLLIDGNFGVRGTSTSQNTSSVVGDINLEYKITQDGRFRVKAFNRTNNLSILENNAPYTQGVGVFYRREFERFGDLFGHSPKGKSTSDSSNETPNEKAIIESALRDED